MKTIVITGSTRGIGRALASAFLDLNCRVVVSGRTSAAVQSTVDKLASKASPEQVWGQACDVRDFQQVQDLWDGARSHFGPVDIWINNAGVAHPQSPFWKHPPERIRSVVETNTIGAMNGTMVAIQGMLMQGSGAFYNMEGLGSDGRRVEGMALYGSTKASLSYLTDSLVGETRGTPVLVSAIRPGMVVTDLLTNQYENKPEDWDRAKRIFNILADRPEVVMPWVARRVLENKKHGARINWLTRGKVITRFLTARFTKRNLFGDDTE